MGESKRLVWADSLKGVLIILVVLGHAIQWTIKDDCYNNHLWNIIYSFHMPAFMALSGYLAYKNNSQKCICMNAFISIIYRRFRQLIIPFVLWGVIGIALSGALSISSFVDILLFPDKKFWFLWALFFIYVLFAMGDRLALKMKISQELIIGIICALLFGAMALFQIKVLGFQFIAYYFFFYSLGYYLHKYQNCIFTSKTYMIVVMFVLWAFLAWFWEMHSAPSFLQNISGPPAILQYGYRLITAIVATYVIFAVGPTLMNKNQGLNKHFVHLGKISLGIYTAHLILVSYIVDVYKLYFDSTFTIITFTFISALVLSWCIVWALGKWNITEKLLLGRI